MSRKNIYAPESTPEPVKKALEHVASFHPEVTMVVFNVLGQWCYTDFGFNEPMIFSSEIDEGILQAASDSVDVLPAVFCIEGTI
jgi:hypothetical protein